MKIYLAPMEGITGYVYRNVINKIYGGIDKYFTPFIVPTIKREFKQRELRDILPENNKGMEVVPQILTNEAAGFLSTVNSLKKYGYKEVNLNLGCPSGTVVSKGKGAGGLKNLDELRRLLDGIFEKVDINVSIKTRIGMEEESEWNNILDIYNEYPISELIVHPRLRVDFYKNPIHMDSFCYAYKNSKVKPCYNGDIKSIADYIRICEMYPEINAVMIGRGLIEKPYLAELIKDTENVDCEVKNKTDRDYRNEVNAQKERFFAFHDELFEGYVREMQEENNVLHKMKEMWFYLGNEHDFMGGDEVDRIIKKIKKLKRASEYKVMIERLRNNVICEKQEE